MRITAALSWFDEPSVLLERCVLSLAGTADALVALDGRWEDFPAEHDLSSLRESAAISRAAACAGLELQIFSGGAPFAFESQPAKRTELLRLAAETGADWILVIDADERVESCERALVNELLASTHRDVAEVQLRNVGEGVKNLAARPARRLLRTSAGPRVEPAHNYIRARDCRWLAGDARLVEVQPAADLTAALEIINNVGARPKPRRLAAERYYKTRREALPT